MHALVLLTAASQSGTTAGGGSGLPLWLVCALVFVALLLVSIILFFAPGEYARRVAKRSRLAEINRYRMVEVVGQDEEMLEAAPTQSALTTRALEAVDRGLRARGKRAAVISELERAGMRIKPEEWAGIQIITFVGGALLFGALLGVMGLILGAFLGFAGCRGFIRIKTSRRKAAFEQQLPDALQLLAGALRSGFALNQSIAGLVREGTEPVASEFGRALAEVRLGSDLEEALDAVAERMGSYDMRLVCMAIRTAREVGGNLAEIIATTVATMRERSQLRATVKVLSAEGRTSAKVLTALPFALAAFLLVTKPGYLNPLLSSFTGIMLLAGGGVLLAAGIFWISRIVKIEV